MLAAPPAMSSRVPEPALARVAAAGYIIAVRYHIIHRTRYVYEGVVTV